MKTVHTIGFPLSLLAALFVSDYQPQLIIPFLFGGPGLLLTLFPLDNEPRWRYVGIALLAITCFLLAYSLFSHK